MVAELGSSRVELEDSGNLYGRDDTGRVENGPGKARWWLDEMPYVYFEITVYNNASVW